MDNPTETIRLLKQLRHVTRAPITLCREALTVCGCNLDKAIEFVRTRHKPPKPAAERAGKIVAHVHQGRIGVLAEVRCATDFAANTEQFQGLCKELALQIIGMGDEDVLNQPYVRDPKQTVNDLIASVSTQIGEPISLKRAIRWELSDAGE